MSEEDLILVDLDDELLVYDTRNHQACLFHGKEAKRLRGARARRKVLAGLLALGAGIMMPAPAVAQAASSCLQRCGFGDRGRTCEHHRQCRGTCRGPGICA